MTDRGSLESKAEGGDGSEAETQDLARLFTYRIWALGRYLALEGNRSYTRHFGMSLAQWRVLSTLGYFGEMSIRDIADHISMDRGQTSRTVDALIAGGYVRMRPNIKDRRSTLLSLSKDGEALYAKALPLAHERQRKMLQGFAQSDIDTFSRMLDELTSRAVKAVEED